MLRKRAADVARLWLSQQALAAGAVGGSQRGYSQLITPTLINKGVKRGPGGRSSISGITATVFGCTGFLGRYIVNALAKTGSQVVCPYRCDDLDAQHLRTMGDLGQIIQYKEFNLRNDDQIAETIHRSNLVINLLGIDKETANWGFEETHIDAAQRIAKAASENEMVERFWHVSCIGATKDAKSRRLQSKYEGEQAVRRMLPNATVFKSAHMIGQEDRLFNNYAQLAKKFPVIPLIEGGHNKLQPVYVRDVADAMINSLKTKDSIGATYYLAGPDVITNKELAALTSETMRENFYSVPMPAAIALMMAKPREAALKRRIPFPVNTIFTEDYIRECLQDHTLPDTPGIKTFKDLEVDPQTILKGQPIEHVRYYRVGGYDFGTTGSSASTGGAGFGGEDTSSSARGSGRAVRA